MGLAVTTDEKKISQVYFYIVLVGNTTHSVALVADSFHMLSDVIAIIIAYISVRYRFTSSKKWESLSPSSILRSQWIQR
jgi:hypothetical protein